jgi:hypothetical protein
MNSYQLHRSVHPLSTTVRGHAHFPYSGIQSQKISPIFFRKTLHHGISIVSKNLFYVYSIEYMSLSLFLGASQCRYFPVYHFFFMFLVTMQVRNGSHQWNPAMIYTCICDEKCWQPQLPNHCNFFYFFLQIVRRGGDVLEICVSNIRYHNFF